jgi:hypothetical protein
MTFTGNPVAQRFDDMRTPKQLSCLSMIKRYEGVDVDAVCQRLLGCKADDLTVKAASFLIGYLKGGGR